MLSSFARNGLNDFDKTLNILNYINFLDRNDLPVFTPFEHASILTIFCFNRVLSDFFSDSKNFFNKIRIMYMAYPYSKYSTLT